MYTRKAANEKKTMKRKTRNCIAILHRIRIDCRTNQKNKSNKLKRKRKKLTNFLSQFETHSTHRLYRWIQSAWLKNRLLLLHDAGGGSAFVGVFFCLFFRFRFVFFFSLNVQRSISSTSALIRNKLIGGFWFVRLPSVVVVIVCSFPSFRYQ